MKKKTKVKIEKHEEEFVLTKSQKKEIYTMFFGPYLDEWKTKKGIVDNSDPTIAKRLGLSVNAVSAETSKICKDHFKMIEKLYMYKKR